MNIFLVGFMGCGKSTIGKKLAKKLDYQFIDSDTFIENREKDSVESIFNKSGEDYFRKLETEFLEEIDFDKTIIALGGGTPCDPDRLKLIQKKGELIYIDLPAEALCDRLIQAKKPRPLIDELKSQPEELLNFINSKLEERKPFYSQANYTISGINLTTERLDLLIKMITY